MKLPNFFRLAVRGFKEPHPWVNRRLRRLLRQDCVERAERKQPRIDQSKIHTVDSSTNPYSLAGGAAACKLGPITHEQFDAFKKSIPKE